MKYVITVNQEPNDNEAEIIDGGPWRGEND